MDKLAVMRCLTLLGVDDTVAELSAALDELGVADNTYFIYTSDRKPASPGRSRSGPCMTPPCMPLPPQYGTLRSRIAGHPTVA